MGFHNKQFQFSFKNLRNLQKDSFFVKMAGPSDNSMTWLYDENTAKPKEEDFLLGKAVDANFEKGTMGQINAVEYDCAPASIFASKAEHQVDIQRKLQEEPLIELRKTEVETRK